MSAPVAVLDRPVAAAAARSHADDAAITVEWTRHLMLAGDDAVTLDRILAARPEVAVFMSPAWLAGFLEDPVDGEPGFAILRQGSTIRGIAPIAVRRTRTQTRVSLLGGSFGSDRVDLVTARGFEGTGSDAFLQWLQATFGERGFVLELRDVPAASPLWGAISRATAEHRPGGAVQPREVNVLPYLDLHERLPETIGNAAPSASSLRSIEKHRRMLERRGPLRIERLDRPEQALEAFDCLVRFLHARWHRSSEGSALDDPRTRRFHERALPRLLEAGSLRMIRFAVADRTIAVFYGMAHGGWWGYYLCGYDRDWAGRIHLGQVAIAGAIEMARAEGAREFDFLKGAYRMKYAWPVKERSTIDADVFSGRSAAQLTRAVRAGRDAAAALGKSARHLLSH